MIRKATQIVIPIVSSLELDVKHLEKEQSEAEK